MSRDSDKKKNNKKHREEIRNISSIENGTSRAYRQKVLVRQAGKLVDELERARREEQETQADGIIRQKRGSGSNNAGQWCTQIMGNCTEQVSTKGFLT